MVYIVLIIIILGILLYVNLRPKAKETERPEPEAGEEHQLAPTDCCGAHEICEFNEADFNEEIITYFNDEELDKLRNVRESDITTAQIDELREVLYTLKTNEINQWMVSLGRRHIHLPAILKQEARQLVAEQQLQTR